MNERFDEIESKIKRIEQLIRGGEREEELYQKEQCVEKCRTVLSDIKQSLDEIEREMMNESQDTRYEKKLSSLRKDYDIAQKRVNKFDEVVTRDVNKNKLKNGELHGVKKVQAERDAIIDLHKETDIQGDMIKEIEKDVREANVNLKDVGVELNNQKGQMLRIQGGLQDAIIGVKKSDKIINEMNRRNFCIKFLMHLVIILLALGIITLGVLLIYQKFIRQ